MKLLIVCLALAVVAQASTEFQHLREEWMKFKLSYQKIYDSIVEEEYRFKTFIENKMQIDSHNKRYVLGLETFTMKVNQFADMSHDEYVQAMLSSYVPSNNTGEIQYFSEADTNSAAVVDWRQKGAVTGVKNQANCGSCWAFSATGAIEGQTFIKTGRLVSLSEQNLVDCSKANHGCSGGSMILAFLYVKQNGGIDTEASYPYIARDSTCKYNPANRGATVTGYRQVAHSEAQLQSAVASVGPISIAIDASGSNFRFYDHGVYVDRCSSSQLNHGVLAVGYGSEGGLDYWLVKNSWGTDWGDQGYIKMARNRNNQCGVATDASYPTV